MNSKKIYRGNLKTFIILLILSSGFLVFILSLLLKDLKSATAYHLVLSILLFLGFLFLLIMLIIDHVTNKYVWDNSILQSYKFGRLKWQVDSSQQRIYAQLYESRVKSITRYIEIIYEQKGMVHKQHLQGLENIFELYVQLYPLNDPTLYLDNEQLFPVEDSSNLLEIDSKRYGYYNIAIRIEEAKARAARE